MINWKKQVIILFYCIILSRVMILTLIVLSQRQTTDYRSEVQTQNEAKKVTPPQDNIEENKEEKSNHEQGLSRDQELNIKEDDGNDKQIRVLLMTSQFSSIYHKKVEICSNMDYEFYNIQKKKWEKKKKGECISLSENDCPDEENQKEAYIICYQKNQFSHEFQMSVNSIERAQGVPDYEGTLQIYLTKNGFVIVNELPLEEYLRLVIPSEMPASYEMDALMAQAICARTYAYLRIQQDETYQDFSANVDDSTGYQVYGNCATCERTDQAVKATAGMVLLYEQEPIDARFFSTSCGRTEDGAFSYLKGKSIGKTAEKDLSNEKDFQEYINQIQKKDYEKSFPYYRWTIKLSNKMKEQIKSIQVIKRSKNGRIQSVSLQKKAGTKWIEQKVEGEQKIRTFFASFSEKIIKSDDTIEECGKMIPSAFFYFKETKDSYELIGGGYGHGIGLSQNGANAMALKGFHYQQILSFFYSKTKLEVPRK